MLKSSITIAVGEVKVKKKLNQRIQGSYIEKTEEINEENHETIV